MDDFAIGGTDGLPPLPPAAATDEAEVDAVATWFARIGAGALLLAAAFAYSYAVDRGLITPPVRVAMGAALGALLLIGSEWARQREWPAFAQAIAGAGVGMWYLVTWAAYERYALIPGPAAFVVLAAVSALGVGLAWRHDSEVLAGFGTLGAFLVPALVSSALDPLPVLGYILLVDLAILAAVTVRPWRWIGRVSLVGTWIFAGLSADAAGPGASLVYGALFWTAFAFHPLVRASLGRRVPLEEAAVAVTNAFAFWTFAMLVTEGTGLEAVRGAVTAGIGAACLALWSAARDLPAARGPLVATLVSLGGGFLALAVPIQFDGPAIPAAWTVQAVALVAVGTSARSQTARWAGVSLLGIALLQSMGVEFALGLTYDATPPLVSGDSFTILLQVAALHLVSRLLRSAEDPAEASASASASVGAHALTLAWGAMEAAAYWIGTTARPESAIQYSLTVEWSLYAAGLLTAGVLMRRRRARLLAVALFVVTIGKVAMVDLWTLSTPHRIIAFGALGAMLLACSLLYHRFRALILEGTPR